LEKNVGILNNLQNVKGWEKKVGKKAGKSLIFKYSSFVFYNSSCNKKLDF